MMMLEGKKVDEMKELRWSYVLEGSARGAIASPPTIRAASPLGRGSAGPNGPRERLPRSAGSPQSADALRIRLNVLESA